MHPCDSDNCEKGGYREKNVDTGMSEKREKKREEEEARNERKKKGARESSALSKKRKKKERSEVLLLFKVQMKGSAEGSFDSPLRRPPLAAQAERLQLE